MNRIIPTLFSLIFCAVGVFDVFAMDWPAYLRPGFMSREGSTAGYMDYFLPVMGDEKSLWFMNPKVSVTDDDANEQNIGVGYRRLVGEQSWILGGNIFYDTRKSTYGNRFQQVGTGLEALSKWVDVRVNYYHPTTGDQLVETRTAAGTFVFSETALLQSTPTFDLIEEPLSGVDYEIGFLIPWVSDLVETRVYGGGYFYDSRSSSNVQGGRLRAEVRPNRFFTLEVKVDYDIDFGTSTSFGGFVSLPFEIGNIFQGKNPFSGWKDALALGQGPRTVPERMTERVVRDLDIISAAKEFRGPDLIEQQAGLIFVDNSNDGDAGEDGTRSHPYNTLSEAFTDSRYASGIWVRVEEGDGTATGYTGNFTLANNVTLWGSGYDGGFSGISATAGNPLINGSGGDVITLGSGNTVMGVTVQNGTRGIFGLNPGTVTIRNSTVTGSSSDGIRLDTDGSNTAAITLTANTVTNNTDDGIDVKSNDSSVIRATLLGSSFSGNDDGILFQSFDSSQLTGTVQNNTGQDALKGEANNTSTMTTTFTGNVVTNPGGIGIEAATFNTAVHNSTISENSVSGSTSENIFVTAIGASTVNAVVTNNVVSGNGSSGGIFVFTQSSGGAVNATLSGNTIKDNATGLSGLTIVINDGGQGNVPVSQSIFQDNATGTLVGFAGFDGTYNVDFGGGSLNSPGQNSFSGNTLDFDSRTAVTIKAENNWWGNDDPQDGQFSGNVDFEPFLTSNPN